MSLQVTFDSNSRDRVDFAIVRDHLLSTGATFDPEALTFIPYEQLALCATGEAAAAACTLDLVRQEKFDRRRAFLSIPPDELFEIRRYLQAQAMHTDVHAQRQLQSAPCWADLDSLQRTWFLLVCVNNHIDAPRRRLQAAVKTLEHAGSVGLAPEYAVTSISTAIRNLVVRYPSDIGSEDLRSMVSFHAEEVIHLMSAEERQASSREVIFDYQCTSDCFQPTLRSIDMQ